MCGLGECEHDMETCSDYGNESMMREHALIARMRACCMDMLRLRECEYDVGTCADCVNESMMRGHTQLA